MPERDAMPNPPVRGPQAGNAADEARTAAYHGR